MLFSGAEILPDPSRVVGGTTAATGEFPFIVSLINLHRIMHFLNNIEIKQNMFLNLFIEQK